MIYPEYFITLRRKAAKFLTGFPLENSPQSFLRKRGIDSLEKSPQSSLDKRGLIWEIAKKAIPYLLISTCSGSAFIKKYYSRDSAFIFAR